MKRQDRFLDGKNKHPKTGHSSQVNFIDVMQTQPTF